LPPGYEAQPAWGFRDRTGRCFYEFNRVYAPPLDPFDARGPVCPLDEDLSYWSAVWPTSGDTGAGRWMSYARARKLRGSRFTFEQFSSLSRMRAELPGLLHVGDASLEPRLNAARASARASRAPQSMPALQHGS